MPNQLYYVQNTTNLGDAVNPAIFQDVLDIKVDSASHTKADVFGIGSILEKAFIHNKPNSSLLRNFWRNRKKYAARPAKELFIFGSGFLRDGRNDLRGYRTYRPIAVRGKLTREVLSHVLQMELDEIALGDPGLLMNRLIKNQPVKKYKLGIIPHYVDKTNPLVHEMAKTNTDTQVIDICGDPIDTLRNIAECETIASSAMHGLVAADSLGIPNKWVKFSDLIMGDDFKFHDYYSAFDLKTKPTDMRRSNVGSICPGSISDDYQVRKETVDAICDQLITASKTITMSSSASRNDSG